MKRIESPEPQRPVYDLNAVIDIHQLAAALGVSTRTIERMDLPTIYFGRRTRRYIYGQVLRVLEERAA